MKKYKLGEIAKEISSGATPARNNPLYWENGNIAWLKTEQIGEYKIRDTNEHITQLALDETGLKLYPKNTISIAMYGEGKTRGNVSITDCELTTNQACCNIVSSDIVEPFYLYYVLKTQYQNFRKLSSGIRNNLNTNIIKKYEVYLPLKEKQIKIANFLQAIDNKIAVNNEINKLLEQSARAIYEYYFVQFDFPNTNGKPYKSSGGEMIFNPTLNHHIPKTFEVKVMKDFLSVVTGKEDANFATKNGQYAFFTCGDEILRCDKSVFKGKAILIAGNGNFNVKYFDGEFNAYQRTYVLIPKNELYAGILYFSALNRIDIFTKGSNGSIVKFITKGDIENIPVILPNDTQILSVFNTILDKQNLIRIENQKLKALRDFLLPLLLNAQVKIK